MSEFENVVLVDEQGNETGLMPKLEAHQKGVLHRAFSIFIFNANNQLMIHQRSANKYHSAGLWTNTCCSHPRKGESVVDAGQRRLMEEMGFTTQLTELIHFTYICKMENGLFEHEFDHVLVGYYDGSPKVNLEEVSDWRWENLDDIQSQLATNPEHYTRWLPIALQKLQPFLVGY
ncbi:isopentenyl-diphosphate Delta-isomerase [Pseudoalteromonas fuliginea]|uniref:isopentenyl-diphosphate Delta-isomerase n=2 Tax=Pseudoalteromonas TaxID=53246 RepID=UPI0002AAAC74|nr:MULTISPECIES: isopentenyl-diphosphate Delta-isomerase [unclassified Pseudoalteromonas]ALQ08753.1 isopentenyl-diphosphate delta-isomerase [Pseudoalteromonas sp. Bsw20308]MDQ2046068.1 isopentenyl-diphosphate Delta-isomerase [Pseudoalteromonas sp. 20-92]